jgi:hypothetical protein
VVSRRLLRYAVPPGLFPECITHASSTTESYLRARHQIERRQAVHRFLPAHSYSKRDEQLLPNTAAMDPWAVNQAELAATSRVITRCPGCDGTKKTFCTICSGLGRVRCRYCGGGGRVQGERGFKNCPECRGRGDVRCDFCSRGKVDCETCDAAGRVEAWIFIDRQIVVETRRHPSNAAAGVHARALDPADFDAGPWAWPNRLVSDTGVQAPNHVPIPAELAPFLNPRSDRLVSVRIQRFEGEVHRFRYGVLGRSALVELAGTPPRFTAKSDFGPLVLRAGVLGGIAVFVAMTATIIAASYAARGTWYATYGQGSTIAWLLFLGFVGAVIAAAGMTLPRRAWRAAFTWAPMCTALGALVAAVVVYAGSGPTKREGEVALSSGDTRRAEMVGSALVDLGIDREGGGAILDQILYRELLGTDALDDKGDIAAKYWHGAAFEDKARRHVLDEAHRWAGEHAKTCHADGLEEVSTAVEHLDEAYADELSSRAALCRIPKCAEGGDCACVERHLAQAVHVPKQTRDAVRELAQGAFHGAFVDAAKRADETSDTKARVALLTKAVGLAACSSKLGRTVDAATLGKLERDRQTAATRLAIEERQAARAEELKRQQEEARQQLAIAAAREANRSVRCCDGTLSPSCLCSRPSKRGCCSHHGGICGCE